MGNMLTRLVWGPTRIVLEKMQETIEEKVHDSAYGPWIVVSRKMCGARSQRTNKGPLGQENEQGRNRNPHRSVVKDKWTSEGAIRDDQSVGLSRETKRKNSPSKVTLGAQGACSNIDLEGLKNLRGLRLSGRRPIWSLNQARMH